MKKNEFFYVSNLSIGIHKPSLFFIYLFIRTIFLLLIDNTLFYAIYTFYL